MKGLLPDINIQGHTELIQQLWQSDPWRDLWEDLKLTFRTFAGEGLTVETSDAVIWRHCQQQQLVLVTPNRNARGSDSLEITIRNENTPESLPVFTIADSERFRINKSHAHRVAIKLLEYLHDIDNYRGAGRVWLP